MSAPHGSDDDLRIEACAVRAWPALEVEEAGGWLLRSTPGVERRRSHSALPPRRPDAGDGLGFVERFYRQRGRDPLIQLAPSHRHRELDDHLARRGYEIEAPTLVLAADLPVPGAGERAVGALAPPERRVHPGTSVQLGDRDRQWALARDAISGTSDASGQRVIDRIAARTTFARAIRDGAVVGVGAGVLDDHRLGVFEMGTAAEHRRGGVAGAVLSALLRWGADAGATSAWLQVEEANHAARELYAAHGFVLSHRYHYRRGAS